MKKEVLLSLLMTTPVAFPALAASQLVNLDDIAKQNEGESRWKPNGGGLTDTALPNDGTGMNCLAGINYIERTLTLPMGAYTLEFNN